VCVCVCSPCTLTHAHTATWAHPLNSQAVTPLRLYGQFNKSTQSWQDGVITKVLRGVNGPSDTRRAWVVSGSSGLAGAL